MISLEMTILQEKYNKNQNAILEQQKQRLYQRWKNSGLIADDSVLDAFLEVPRELFVDPSDLDQSYADHALPIGSGQTISQPTTVILMLQLLDVLPGHRVLEIGTGSGYNAALLAKLVKPAGMVVTMERHGKLVEEAGQNLLNAGLDEVVVISGDGKLGYAEMAPYDRIIVTAAADQVPQILKDQLVIGGRLVAPVGATYGCEMLKLNKTSPDHFETSSHGLFSFVPLI